MSSLLIKNARYLGDSVDLLVVDGKVQSLSARRRRNRGCRRENPVPEFH